MGWITMVFEWLGALLKQILPVIFDEFKKPTKVEQVGETPEMKENIQDDIFKKNKENAERIEQLLKDAGK
jgi:hypothetical protein